MASHRACSSVSSLGTGWGGTQCLGSHTQPQAGACAAFGQGRLLFFISFPVRLTYSLSLCLNLSLVLLLSLNHPRLVFLSASHSRILHQALPLPPSPTLPLLLSLRLPLHAAFPPSCLLSPAAVAAREHGVVRKHGAFFLLFSRSWWLLSHRPFKHSHSVSITAPAARHWGFF